ncbi:Replication termination factor 2 [Knufia obscura]|uniref:Replication termination factor 2 n=1 Tax=Knufia obscura TaxID=1635080 RepID=A0ABR0R994_9EURO|nr:Replication termination factor 2 [Knufia obscura]
MGNDGGSIPTRRELVKESAKPKTLTEMKEKQQEHLAHRWSQCPLSHTALKKPVVADYAGDLYNKDAIIQFLLPEDVSTLDKAEAETFLGGRVKSLKDVVEIQFEVEHDEKKNIDKWICPVTGKELGPAVKAVYIVPCGHAFSHEAIKAVKSNECVQCSQTYDNSRDVVPVLPITDADKQSVIERIEKLREQGLTHSLKKDKSAKKRKAKDAIVEEEKAADGKAKDQAKDGDAKSAGIKNSSTAGLTARVLEEQDAKKKRRLLNENENIQSLYSSGNKKHNDADFMTRGFSIPAGAKHG